MLAEINPVVLPALRIAGNVLLVVQCNRGAYISFEIVIGFIDQDPNISEDIEPVRKLRVEGSL